MKNSIIVLVFHVTILWKFTKLDELELKLNSTSEASVSTTAKGVIDEVKKTQGELLSNKTTIKMLKTTKETNSSELLITSLAATTTTTTTTTTLGKSKTTKEMKPLDVSTATEKLKAMKEAKLTEFSSTTTTEKSEVKGMKSSESTQITTTQTPVETFTSGTHKNSTILTDSTLPSFIASSDCSCDLKKNVCDVNCCCDMDCSASDRAVFSACYVHPNLTSDLKYCYSSQFIFKNNTQFKIQKEANSGLFCILIDNSLTQSVYENVQIINDANQVKKLQRLMNRYSWPDSKLALVEKFEPERSYKHGSILWAVNSNSNIFPLSLPKSTASTSCRNKKKLIYLENWSSSCRRSIMNESECVSNIFNAEVHFKHYQILRSPLLINASDFEACNSTLCSSIKPLLCSTNFYNCSNVTHSIANFYDGTKNICYNVLHSLMLEVVHNGTLGIKEIKAYLQLRNVSLAPHQPISFVQNYKITFKWLNQTNTTLERSGFPGYLYKKPLISGFKIQVSLIKEVNKSVIQFHADHKRWISLIKSDEKLNCHQSERMNILFGRNLQTSCQYTFPDDSLSTAEACLNLNVKIMETLLGTNITNNAVNLFISSLGDPKTNEMKNWIPVILQEQQRGECYDIVTGMKLKVLYAFVGSVVNPQAKIIGISLDFQRQSLSSQNANLFCHFKICSLTLTSSVFFIDTTKSSYFKFAEIPVYEIKLPQDFFYPFLSSASFIHSDNKYFQLLFFTFVFIYRRP